MASVPLRFVPPDVPDLASLKVWESSAKDGTFSLIDTVTEIGDYPDYISSYTTDNAVLATDWFAISWTDIGGAETPLSAPLQGGETTLVAQIMQRVRERNPNVNLNVAQQEAEVAIQYYFGDNVDPYDPALVDQVSYRVLNGLTYLTLARTLIAELLTHAEVNSATVGLVSFKTASSKALLDNLQELIDIAELDLGISGSTVLDLKRICHVYGGPDPRIARLLLQTDQEYVFIPYRPWPIERP